MKKLLVLILIITFSSSCARFKTRKMRHEICIQNIIEEYMERDVDFDIKEVQRVCCLVWRVKY